MSKDVNRKRNAYQFLMLSKLNTIEKNEKKDSSQKKIYKISLETLRKQSLSQTLSDLLRREGIVEPERVIAEIFRKYGKNIQLTSIKDLVKIEGVNRRSAFRIAAILTIFGKIISDVRNQSTSIVSDGTSIQSTSIQSLFDTILDEGTSSHRYEIQRKKLFSKKFRFIDLFAGIGGFHLAGDSLGGRCVFVSEFDTDAREVYRKNFEKTNKNLFDSGNFVGDITKVDEKDIPSFDFLFAGFPCQPFSKGGHRRGFDDTRGTLFFDIARIVQYHRPKYLLLENVSNLVTHDSGNTFRIILEKLFSLGYALNTQPIILSPHQFGLPVIRQRVYIPAIRRDLIGSPIFDLDIARDFRPALSDGAFRMLDKKRKPERYSLSEYERKVLDVWNEFHNGIDIKTIGFPIWSEEFGKTYDTSHLPDWKQNFIIKNRDLYKRNQKFIEKWLKRHNQLEWMVPTHRKLEWQAGEDILDIYGGLIQFRPSGVRVKRPDKFSTLVAMNHPQIVGKYRRRLTADETKRLQSFPEEFDLHENENIALKQLGNAVNVEVVRTVVRHMFEVTKSI